MAVEEWKFKALMDDMKELRRTFQKFEAAMAPARVSELVIERKAPAIRQLADGRAEALVKRLRGFLWDPVEQAEMTPLYVAWRNGTATNAEKDRLLFLTLKGLFQA